MKMIKKVSARIGLVALGTLLALMILEGYLRMSGVTGYQETLGIYEFDETLGWRTKQSSRTFRSTRNFAHFNYFNPQGFPVDRENWRKSLDRNTPSIAFIGDSFTEGFYLPYEETFTYLVDQRFPNKQVVNLGVSGYAPDQYLLAARRHLGEYNITYVVGMFFPANDIPDLLKTEASGYAKPVFGESLDAPLNTPLQKLEGDSRVGFRGTVLRTLNDRSALARVSNPLIFKYFPGLMGVSAPELTPVEYSDLEMRKALRVIQQIAVEFPVERFVVYYVPEIAEVLDREIFNENIILFQDLCAELDLECHTPESTFQKVSDPNDLYIPVNRHFSKLGASLVADQIYQILSSYAVR